MLWGQIKTPTARLADLYSIDVGLRKKNDGQTLQKKIRQTLEKN